LSGPVGSGKTLFVVKGLKNSSLECYSNIKLEIPNYHHLRLIDMLDLPKGINVFIDEGYTILESRTSSKYTNLFLSYIVFQLRKTKRNIFVTVQEVSSIDIRYRRQWDYYIQCERINDSQLDSDLWDFKFVIYDKKKHSRSNWILSYKEAMKVFPFFDTYEIVPVSAKSRITYELLKTEPDQLLMKSLELAKNVKKRLKNVTVESVKFTLMTLGYDQIWYNSVYTILKNYYSNL
jgi:hypothetical protein